MHLDKDWWTFIERQNTDDLNLENQISLLNKRKEVDVLMTSIDKDTKVMDQTVITIPNDKIDKLIQTLQYWQKLNSKGN